MYLNEISVFSYIAASLCFFSLIKCEKKLDRILQLIIQEVVVLYILFDFIKII